MNDYADMQHLPVMPAEVLHFLDPQPNQHYVDLTVGGGGHAQSILQKTEPGGHVYAFDRDKKALHASRTRLRAQVSRCTFFHKPMSDVGQLLPTFLPRELSGALIDCGVSSFQLDDARRGFSLKHDGPLDMRMDSDRTLTAEQLLRQVSEQQLADIIYQYGEERFSRRIARAIKLSLSSGSIDSTYALAQVVAKAVPSRSHAIHPATRTFQALRIAVNDELQELTLALQQLVQGLKKGARIVVISFHSLEDRIVKHFFRQSAQMGLGVVLTKKPVRPTAEEVQSNRRARSACLRALEMGSAT